MSILALNFFLADGQGYRVVEFPQLRQILSKQDIDGLIKSIKCRAGYYIPVDTNDILEISWG